MPKHIDKNVNENLPDTMPELLSVQFVSDMTEGEFDELVTELKKQRDVEDPEALAAFISIKKEGKETFLKKAELGRKTESETIKYERIDPKKEKKEKPKESKSKSKMNPIYWARKCSEYVTQYKCKNWSRLTESQKVGEWQSGIIEFSLQHEPLNGSFEDVSRWFGKNGFKYGVRALTKETAHA